MVGLMFNEEVNVTISCSFTVAQQSWRQNESKLHKFSGFRKYLNKISNQVVFILKKENTNIFKANKITFCLSNFYSSLAIF